MEIAHESWHHKVLKSGYFILILATVILGMWIRIGPQLARDYWIDEVWRIQEISSTDSYANVEEPIQVGEFYITKTLWAWLGEQEVVSRLLPCAASILLLILIAWYSWKHFSPCVAVLITAIASVSPGLIEHGYEFKPYSVEALFCMLSLIVFTKRRARSKIQLPLQLFFLTLLVPIAFNTVPFLSFLFVFAIYSSLKESRSSITKITGLVIIAALLVASYRYIQFMSPISEAHGMWRFWKPYYLQDLEQVKFFIFDRLSPLIHWYVLPIPGVADVPGVLMLVLLLVVCSVALVVSLTERNSFFVWLFFPPLVMLLLAVFGKYPFATRVSAFYYPMLILAFGFFLNQIYLFISVRPKTLAPFLQITILLSACWFSFQWTPRENPGTGKHIQVSKELFRYVDKHGELDDVFCLSGHAWMLLDYYGMNKKFESERCELPAPREPDLEELKSFLASLQVADDNEAWLMAVHRDRGYSQLKEAIQALGFDLKADLRRPGSFLLLVTPTQTSSE